MKKTLFALLFLALASVAQAQTMAVYPGALNNNAPLGAFRITTQGHITSLVDGNLVTLTAYDDSGLQLANSFTIVLDSFQMATWTSDFTGQDFSGTIMLDTTGPAAVSPARVFSGVNLIHRRLLYSIP